MDVILYILLVIAIVFILLVTIFAGAFIYILAYHIEENSSSNINN